MSSSAKGDHAKEQVDQQGDDPPSPPPYAYVKAVMLYWENSDAFSDHEEEARQLESVFKALDFETVVYHIPISNSQLDLHSFIAQQRVIVARREAIVRGSCLLIIHYTGRGDKDDDVHAVEGPQRRRAVWRA